MQTVIGLYKSVAEANQVKQALVNEGYSGGDVTVIDQSESYDTGYGTTTGSGVSGLTGSNAALTDTVGYGGTPTATSTGADVSVGDKIKHFFSNLTGSDEDTHTAYTQGVSNGGALVAINVSEGEVDRAAALLRQHGATDIENEGGYGNTMGNTAGTTAGYDRTSTNMTGEQVIPVVEEELIVGKRQVERGGVRVFSRVVSEPVSESVNLHEERVIVDRRPVDRPATDADFADAGPIEVHAMGEEAVVGKASRVVEEIVVGKTASDRTETVSDSVRRTEVDMEPVTSTDTTTGTTTSDRFDTTTGTKY